MAPPALSIPSGLWWWEKAYQINLVQPHRLFAGPVLSLADVAEMPSGVYVTVSQVALQLKQCIGHQLCLRRCHGFGGLS